MMSHIFMPIRMKLRLGLRLSALGVCFLGLSAATGWDARYLVVEGTGFCALGGYGSDGTYIGFSTRKVAKDQIGIVISNPKWAIVEDKMYPNVVLGTEAGNFAPAEARGISAGLMLATSRLFMAAFVKEGVREDGTLTVLSDGKLLATFPLAGMRDSYRQFVACDAIKFRDPGAFPKDPFKP